METSTGNDAVNTATTITNDDSTPLSTNQASLLSVDLLAPRPQLQSNVEFDYAVDGSVIDLHIKQGALVTAKHNLVDLPKNVFPFHCLDYTDLRPEVCKFKNRGCLCKTWSLKDPNVRDKFRSLCFYKSSDASVIPIPIDKYKNGVEIADTRLILCSNTECKRVNEESVIVPTSFHYCCYAGMINKEGIDHIKYTNKDVDFHSYQQEQLKTMQPIVENNEIILPVCGKKCYNVILRKRQAYIDKEKKELEEEEDYC